MPGIICEPYGAMLSVSLFCNKINVTDFRLFRRFGVRSEQYNIDDYACTPLSFSVGLISSYGLADHQLPGIVLRPTVTNKTNHNDDRISVR